VTQQPPAPPLPVTARLTSRPHGHVSCPPPAAPAIYATDAPPPSSPAAHQYTTSSALALDIASY
jgi:hypothetical protein